MSPKTDINWPCLGPNFPLPQLTTGEVLASWTVGLGLIPVCVGVARGFRWNDSWRCASTARTGSALSCPNVLDNLARAAPLWIHDSWRRCRFEILPVWCGIPYCLLMQRIRQCVLSVHTHTSFGISLANPHCVLLLMQPQFKSSQPASPKNLLSVEE